MPSTDPKSVNRFTKKAKSPTSRRQWKHVYESALSSGADEGSAIAQASGVVKKRMAKSKGRDRKRSGGKR
jgi:hypothetical protein